VPFKELGGVEVGGARVGTEEELGGSGVDFTVGSFFIIQVSIIACSLLYVSLHILKDRI
jgi:hypothetical protein